MKKNAFKLMALAFFAFLLSSCLTVEKKEYTWEITGPNSGKLTITYINIMSDMDDSLDVSGEDFEELLSSYLYGSYIEDHFPMAENIEKRLFAKDYQLWGEVSMEFNDLQAVHIYQHDKKGPYMFCVNTAPDTEFTWNRMVNLAVIICLLSSGIPKRNNCRLLPLYRKWMSLR